MSYDKTRHLKTTGQKLLIINEGLNVSFLNNVGRIRCANSHAF